MFSKTLILVLLGCSLALAQVESTNEETDVVVLRSSISNKFSTWYDKAKTSIKKAYGKTVQEFEKVYENLVEVGHTVADKTNETFEKLKIQYQETKIAAMKKLREIERAIIPKIMAKLHQILMYLSKKSAEKTAEDIKAVGDKIAQKGEQALNELEEELHETVGQQVGQVKENLGEWKDKVDEFLGSAEHKEMNEEVHGDKEVINDLGEKIHSEGGKIIENKETKEKVNGVKGVIEDLGKKIQGIGEKIIENKEVKETINGVKGIIGGLGDKFKGVGSKIGDFFGKK